MANKDIHAYVPPQVGILKSDAQENQTDAGVGANRAHRDDLESEPSYPLSRSSTRNYANTLHVNTVDTHIDDRTNWDVQYSGLAEIGSAGPGSNYVDTGYGAYTYNGYLESVTENTKSGKVSTNLPRFDTRPDQNNKPAIYESYLNPKSTFKAGEGKQHDKVAFIVLLLLFLFFIVIVIVTGIFVILVVRVKNDVNDLRNENDSLRSKLEELEVKFNESLIFAETLSNRLDNLENETQIFSFQGQNVTERIYALENLKLDTRLKEIEDANLTLRVSTLEGENFAIRIWTLENLEIQTQLTSLGAYFNDLTNENASIRSKLEEFEVKFNESAIFTEILSNRLDKFENEPLVNQTFSLHGQNVTERIDALEKLKLDSRLEKIEDENLANRISSIEGENLGTRIWNLENL